MFVLQGERGGERHVVGAVDVYGLYAARVQMVSEDHMVDHNARPRQPCGVGGVQPLRLVERGVMEAACEQFAEARVRDVRIEVAEDYRDRLMRRGVWGGQILLRVGERTQADDAFGPFAAAALGRFGVCGGERDVAHRRDLQCDGGHVGGGNRHAGGCALRGFDAQPHAVEAAVVACLWVAELAVGQELGEAGGVELAHQVFGQLLQGEHGHVFVTHHAHDFGGVGVAEAAVEREHAEAAVVGVVEAGCALCGLGMRLRFAGFALGDLAGDGLAGVRRLQVVEPVCGLAHERGDEARGAACGESPFAHAQAGDAKGGERDPQHGGEGDQVRQRLVAVPAGWQFGERKPQQADNQDDPQCDEHGGPFD